MDYGDKISRNTDKYVSIFRLSKEEFELNLTMETRGEEGTIEQINRDPLRRFERSLLKRGGLIVTSSEDRQSRHY